MAARTLAFACGALFTHQLAELPDPFYIGLAPLLLPLAARRSAAPIGAVFLLGIAWSVLIAQCALDRRLPADLQGLDLAVEGHIHEVFGNDPDLVRFTLDVERVDTSQAQRARVREWHWRGCRIAVSWYRPVADARPSAGERWQFGLRMRQPRGLRNPGGFDTEHRALRERRCASGYVRAAPPARRLPGGHASLNRLRATIADRIAAQLRDSPSAGVIVALAVGIRDRIPVQQRWTMQRSGTAHLMAISGLHIGLVAAIGMALGRTLARVLPRALLLLPAGHWGAGSALLLAAVYAALAGFSIPTQRALLMLSAFLIAGLLGRRTSRLHGLALALLLVLLVDPLAVHDAGTWLSFVAVGGLMWAIGPHPDAASRAPPNLRMRWPVTIRRHVVLATRVQLAASIVMLPLALTFFGFQSALSPLANLFAIPITGLLVVPLTLSSVLLDAWLPAVANACVGAAAALMEWTFVLLDALVQIDWLFSAARAPSIVALIAAGIGIALLLSPMHGRTRLIGLIWLAPLVLPPSQAPPPGGLNLQILDVGQGLAVVLRTHAHAALFDAGPSWSNGHDAGAGVVVPALHRQGIARLERVLISHQHQDHAGGLPGVMRGVPVSGLLGDHGRPQPEARPCRAGETWRWDGYEFRILHPREGKVGSARPGHTGNNTSCVLRISGPGGSVLLPADIEAPAEASLLATRGARLRSDVLIVPHHGSRTSSTRAFLRAVAPQLAVNSSGHRNRFALPAAAVTQRYRRLQIPFIDTACVGAIEVHLRVGRSPQVHHWRETQLRFWHAREQAVHCRGQAVP